MTVATRKICLLLALVGFSCFGRAFELETQPIGATTAVVVSVSIHENLGIFLNSREGVRYGSFDRLSHELQMDNRELKFGINAGPYHSDGRPVGLYVEDFEMLYPLNENSGSGNFYLKPNGVFLKERNGFAITTTEQFKEQNIPIEFATQSGPILVFRGEINPVFKVNSENNFVRNAVCLKNRESAIFVITNGRINFYTLAKFLKESLGCSDALFLDGYVSSLYVPQIERNDRKIYSSGNAVRLGPILAITTGRNGDNIKLWK